MFATTAHFLLYRLGLASAQTQTTRSERDALTRLARGRKRCVEIGVWHGVTTRRIREAMAPDGVLTGVDPFEPGRLGFSIPRAIALREIAGSRNGTVQLLRMTSAAAARQWREAVDFLFIDGDHTYEGLRLDWEGWSAHVAPGGLVCLHDSRSTPERPLTDAGSVRYTEEVILRDTRFTLAEVVESLTVVRRTGA